MLALCLIAGLLSTCPDDRAGSGSGEALFDGRQAGSLPRMRFERPSAAINPPVAGAPGHGTPRIARPGEPRWDIVRAFPRMAAWEQLPLEPGSVLCSGSGVDADGNTPLAAAFDQRNRRLVIWRGDDPYRSESLAMHRGDGSVTSIDALGGTAAQLADASYSPRSILVLHGTILLECQRNRLGAGAGVDWNEEGISIVRLDRLPSGTWSRTLLADLPEPADGGASVGQPRGSASSMANHFPSTRGRALRESWIPFVDYQHQVNGGALGGQLFLMRAHRVSASAAWEFDGPFLIYEETGPPGRHFHCAGWTPNGVVLSIGDSSLNEVKLLRCADWRRFQDLSQWTVESYFHGFASAGGDLGGAHQFWGVAPGVGLNDLLIGGDNVSSAICSLEVPSAPGKRATFRHVYGLPPGDLGDQGNTALTCNVIVRPTPERDGHAFARTFYEGGAGGAALSRLLWSEDARTFDVVARLPWAAEKHAFAAVLGSWLLLPPKADAGALPWYAQPFDPAPTATRALRLDPPGKNEAAHPAGPLTNVAAGSGCTVTPFLPSDPRYAGFAAALPWNGPIWRVHAAAGHGASLLSASVRTAQWETGVLTVPIMVANLNSASLRVRGQVTNGVSVWGTTFSVVTRDEWFPCTLTTPAHWGAEMDVNQLAILQNPPEPDGELDFLISVGGAYRGVAPGMALPSIAAAETAGESWAQPLPPGARGVTVELWNPELGTDSSVADGLGAPALFTVRSNAGDAVEFRVGHSARLHAWHWRTAADGTERLITAQVLPDVFMQRGDPLRVTVEAHDSRTRVDGVAGGPIDSTASTEFGRWLAEPMGGTLSLVVAGDRHGKVVLPMAVHRVATEVELRALGDADLQAQTCPFDLDGDGDQDDADAFLILSFGGPCETPESCPWDVDGSGSVDVIDAILLSQSFADDPCP